ncbi:RNA chaperone Hfq [Paraburkholderia sabiae]|uniref:RNA chaperone Hfq n=1 Tax=Paraburkholderia sabiae TaxID=273251 RepID=UPI001CC65DB3|nr:RNA chaperone Hfq [Paraburkholderia sabiae]
MATAVDEAQTCYLAELVSERKTIWVFLMNGIRLVGTVTSFDQYVIALQSIEGPQVIYKRAISTISEPFVRYETQADDRKTSRRRRARLTR